MQAAEAARPFPRGALVAAAALVGLALVLALTARLTGVGRMAMPEAAAVSSLELTFQDRADGGVAVVEVPTGRLVQIVEPGTGGFIRGVLRSLTRGRMLDEVGADLPFRLTYWSDGRLTLEDAGTGQRIELESFGPTNMQAFASLLAAGKGAP
jgi:putative photosynthetic complex assembly protein